MNTEIGIVLAIIYKTENSTGDYFYILKVKSSTSTISVKGNSISKLFVGSKIEFSGKEETYNNQKTINSDFLKIHITPDNKGARGWLLSKPVKGLGDISVEKITQSYNDKLTDALKSVDLLVQCGIKKKIAENLVDAWSRVNIPNDILHLFTYNNLSGRNISKIVNTYGSRLSEVINNNPWQLAKDISGLGFKTADDLARQQRLDMQSKERYFAAINHIVSYEIPLNGSSATTKLEILKEMRKMGLNNGPKNEDALNEMLGWGKDIIECEVTQLISTPDRLRIEQKIASIIKDKIDLMDNQNSLDYNSLIDASEKNLGIDLDVSQKQAALLSLRSPISIITGGPGTGKSTTQAIILDVLNNLNEKTLLLAPTGKAAKRLAEATNSEAKTIHRGLEFDSSSFSFSKNANNPVKEENIIIDEASMSDTELTFAILNATQKSKRVIFVGDKDQLPSVGYGQILKDFIDSDIIPTSKLSVIHRQGNESGIIPAAHMINTHKLPKFNQNDFQLVETLDDQILEKLSTLLINEKSYHTMDDIMVLTPMRKNTFGSINLNKHIKSILNPEQKKSNHTVTIRNKVFSVNDKVMQLRNNYDEFIFNGTTGIITKVGMIDEDEFVEVRFPDQTIVYNSENIDEIEHAWASTIHKVQGSEGKLVVIVISSSHSFMLNKNLIYTAVTRAKNKCIFVGPLKTIELGIKKINSNLRYTPLCNLIRKQCELELIQVNTLPNIVPASTNNPKLEQKNPFKISKKTNPFK